MRKLLPLLSLILALGLAAGCGTPAAAAPASSPSSQAPAEAREEGASASAQKEEAETSLPLLQCLYFDQAQVEGGFRDAPDYQLPGKLTAGMVPHHLVASDMIAGFFQMAGAQESPPQRVLIVSPSHFPENCPGEVLTALAAWDTPYGKVEPDRETIGRILESQEIVAVDSPSSVEWDHGAAGLIPFIKYYLPRAEVSVCLLANTLSSQRLEAFQQLAEKLSREGVLVVASADCSHYLTPAQAVPRDAETAQAIECFDYSRILKFTDSNIDSPPSVTTFLRAAEATSASLVQLDHSSSPEKLSQGPNNSIYADGITTYFVYGAWVEEN